MKIRFTKKQAEEVIRWTGMERDADFPALGISPINVVALAKYAYDCERSPGKRALCLRIAQRAAKASDSEFVKGELMRWEEGLSANPIRLEQKRQAEEDFRKLAEVEKFTFDDGGRKAAGFKGFTNDCVVRAISIACNLQYREVYNWVKAHGGNPRNGVHRGIYAPILENYGLKEDKLSPGIGLSATLWEENLPSNCIVQTGKSRRNAKGHLLAIVDGVVRDTYPSMSNPKNEIRMVWTKA